MKTAQTLTNTFRTIILGCMVITSIGFATGCSETTSPESTDALFLSTLPDQDETASDVTDATTDAPMVMVHPSSDKRRVHDFGGGILRRLLKLTPEQREQIRTIRQSHEDCFKSIKDSLRSSEKGIFESFKPQYQTIKDSLSNGSIDSATARKQFKELSAQLRETLKSNPVRAWAKDQFKLCRHAFLDEVRTILTPEQQATWDEWAKNHKKP